jgi:diguanylate cyclase (GGDEF)-like protein
VLKEISTRFSDAMRQTDLIARVGGDEFCILVTGDEPEKAARIVAEKIIESAREPIVHGSLAMEVGASVGIALASIGSTPVTLMHKADQAMYLAKRAGGNRYEVAGSSGGTPSEAASG